MKKIISLLLVGLMVISCACVSADGEVSKAMEEVLISVKTKIDIPAAFSEFTPYANEYDGKVSYNFNWQTEDGNSYIEVGCDDKGRVYRYYFYDNSLKSQKKLTLLSKDDIIKFAENFLKKAVPEAFNDTDDKFIYNQDSWSVSGNSYSIKFDRYHKNDVVKDNYADFRIMVCDDVAYVRSLNVNYNFEYDGEFLYDSSLDYPFSQFYYTGEYIRHFPLELIYRDVHSYGDADSTKTVLVYQTVGGGYVSAVTKEVITEDQNAQLYNSTLGGSGGGVMKEESATNDRVMLTDKELKEIENIEGLISKEKADSIIRALPYVDLTSAMVISSYRINQRDEEYIINLSYNVSNDEDDYKYLSATLDGKTGKVLNMYSGGGYDYEKAELTDEQKETAAKKVDSFLKKVSPDEYSQCKKQEDNSYNYSYSVDFDRYVNGIRYINDGINVTFNVKTGKIISYNLDYEKDRVFDNPATVINSEKALFSMTIAEPVKMLYIMSDGKYQQCFTFKNQNIQIDAFTGEEYVETTYYEKKNYEYSDIKGHWAEEKINKLAEFQIGFDGDEFNPDAPITQYDLLRLFAAGIHYQEYITYPEDMLYENFIYDGILTEEEKNPNAQVLREDAFVYMVRLDGLEKVAKLSNIFKVEYVDGNLLSEGKIGYPAILTGMNIICGNGGYLKPKTPITRAEAAVMVYNYMLNEN